jgi:hypothetical protein
MCSNDQETPDWDQHEDEIFDLFITQNKPLNQVVTHMKEKYNLQATYVTPFYIETLDHETDNTNMTERHSTNTGFHALRT